MKTKSTKLNKGAEPIIESEWNDELGLWQLKVKAEDMKIIDVIGIRTRIDEYLSSLS